MNRSADGTAGPSPTAAKEKEIQQLIDTHETFVVTTHVNPDGDAIGSELAMRQLIRASGKSAQIVNTDPVPELLHFLDPAGELVPYSPAAHDESIAKADVILAVDNSDLARLGAVRSAIEKSAAIKACVDHHPNPDPFWQVLFVDETASCTGEMVYRMLKRAGIVPDPATRRGLYTALVSDTGRFRFGNTNSAAFAMAADLTRDGEDASAIYSLLEERLAPSFLPLCGALFSAAQVYDDGALIVLRVPGELMERHAAQAEDLTEVINFALRVGPSRTAAMFRELPGGSTKISLRSKGSLDVNQLARAHGGGGHRNASGIVLAQPLDRAVESLLPELRKLVEEK